MAEQGGMEGEEEPPKLDRGFGFVGALVLVILAVILCPVLIIGAMVAPSLIEARADGNTAAAVGSLKTLSISQKLYLERSSQKRYGTLTELGKENLIDTALASGTKQEYTFKIGFGKDQGSRYWIKASPVVPGKSGTRYFFMDQSGIIQYSLDDFDIDTAKGKPTRPLKRL